jgi:hypothetical protein
VAHRLAQLFGLPCAARVRLAEPVLGAVVLDHSRMVDRHVGRALLEALDRIAALRHDRLDQLVGGGDGAAGIVDEVRLHCLPLLEVPVSGGRRQRPDVELAPALPRAR